MRIVEGREVASALRLPEAIDAMRRAILRGDKHLSRCPPRTLITREAPFGVFGAMPGYAARSELFIVKIAAMIPARNRDEESVNSQIAVFSGTNGVPIALIDGKVVTNMKCAAISAVVTDQCAVDDARTLGILGSGTQAKEQLRAVCAVRAIRDVHVFSRNPSNVDAWIDAMKCEVDQDVSFIRAQCLEDVCAAADVLATTTTSTTPLFENGAVRLKPHVHINCMGAHNALSRELPSALLSASTLIVEDRDIAIAEAGSVHETAMELEQMLSCSSTTMKQGRTVFSSTGHISLDMCIVELAMQHLNLFDAML